MYFVCRLSEIILTQKNDKRYSHLQGGCIFYGGYIFFAFMHYGHLEEALVVPDVPLEL
jgi:hypothetical protein